MTCQVAVMNNGAIALATDSAVSLGGGHKVYHSAEKLFQLSKEQPIAIMTYGSADMMGVPWDTVIKIYRSHLGNRQFDRVDQYATDFINFLNNQNPLFPNDLDYEHVFAHICNYFKYSVRKAYDKKACETSEALSPTNGPKILDEILTQELSFFERYENLAGVSPDYGKAVVKHYEKIIKDVEVELFNDIKLSQSNRKKTRAICSCMYQKDFFGHEDNSGIVIAGFGAAEPFPAFVRYAVGTITAGSLRYTCKDHAKIDRSCCSIVAPFAQRDMIDMFIDAIHPDLKTCMVNLFSEGLDSYKGSLSSNITNKDTIESIEKIHAGVAKQLKKDFWDKVKDATYENYKGQLFNAISALPKYELATMAETLVNLSAFKMRMSADEEETIGGPIDVAVISKGDGFVWVKKKDLLSKPSPHYAF